MRKLIAVVACVVATAFTIQPAASPRSETAPIDPVLLNVAQRPRLTPAQQFLAEVNRAYRTVMYVESLRAHYAAVRELAATAAEAKRSAQQARAGSRGGTHSPARAVPQYGSGRCGGALPPCYVMQRESGGSLSAENPVSTASGKWQFLDSTWAGYGGYAHASDAPESVQDARAREVWNGGAGCSNWSAC